MMFEIAALVLFTQFPMGSCQYGSDMDDSDYYRTAQQHGDVGQYAADNYAKPAAQGCVNGAAAGFSVTRTTHGAVTGCVAGACGNVAQTAVWPEDNK